MLVHIKYDMDKVRLDKNSRYKNGYYVPQNPQKYVGDVNNIIYRSSWELRLCKFLDATEAVIYWNSEQLQIPYLYTLDNKIHKYHIDFVAKMKTRDGTLKTYILEVKPHKETIPPKTRIKKRMILETETFIKNQCKWNAATEYAKQNNSTFLVLTEFDLGIKKRDTK
jgi:hypothetical protein